MIRANSSIQGVTKQGYRSQRDVSLKMTSRISIKIHYREALNAESYKDQQSNAWEALNAES